MSRPRLEVDYDMVRRLHDAGWGSRSIARKLGVSRSLVQRYLARIDEGAASDRGASHTGETGSTYSESDRRHAHRLLEIGRGNATDKEFEAAQGRLDEMLDTEPDSTPSRLADQAEREMEERIEKRENAARCAQEAREKWERLALDDLKSRWDDEVRLASRRIAHLDYFERSKIETAVNEEKGRAETLLARRMKEMKTGAITEALVDRLIEEGLERVADLLEGSR
jgi:hypothetical protein